MSKTKQPRKTHAEQLEELDRKIWERKRNLGPGEGPSGDWTLCDIGPENAYLNLTSKAIRKIDENDIKGFWKEACSLITNENLEYIFNSIDAYHDFLIKGVLLVYSRSDKCPNSLIEFIESQLKTTSKTLKEMLEKRGEEATEEIGVGFISLSNMISIIEKDFFKTIEFVAYYKTVLQNELKKLLGEKESVPTSPEGLAIKQREIEKENFLCSPRNWEIETKTIERDLIGIFNTKVYPKLTPRQKIIIKRLKQGEKQESIAEDLGITDRMVRYERDRIIEIFDETIK